MRPFLLLLTSLLSAMTVAAQELPDGPGKAALVKVCSSCHGPEMVLGWALTAPQWKEMVTDMVSRGADGTDQEVAQILEYLVKNFPPKINLNTASAKELETRLELTSKEAEALVRRREQSKFKSLDDLRSIAEVDIHKIEKKKDLLAF